MAKKGILLFRERGEDTFFRPSPPDRTNGGDVRVHFHRRFFTVAFSSVFPPSLSLSSLFHHRFLFRHFSTIDFSSVAFPPSARPSFFNRFVPPKVSISCFVSRFCSFFSL
uniref:Uncharacterized protein n=1 Tax=Cucumis melo TaxID=3656 RepID=A0A9I9ECI7_CUCME